MNTFIIRKTKAFTPDLFSPDPGVVIVQLINFLFTIFSFVTIVFIVIYITKYIILSVRKDKKARNAAGQNILQITKIFIIGLIIYSIYYFIRGYIIGSQGHGAVFSI